MSAIWIFITVVFVHPSVGLAFLFGENFNIGYDVQILKPNAVILARYRGSITFCHFIPLSVALSLAEDHKVNTNQNLLSSFSRLLNCLRWKFIR